MITAQCNQVKQEKLSTTYVHLTDQFLIYDMYSTVRMQRLT